MDKSDGSDNVPTMAGSGMTQVEFDRLIENSDKCFWSDETNKPPPSLTFTGDLMSDFHQQTGLPFATDFFMQGAELIASDRRRFVVVENLSTPEEKERGISRVVFEEVKKRDV